MPIIITSSNNGCSSGISIADGIIPSTHTVHVLIAQIKYVYSQPASNHFTSYNSKYRMQNGHRWERDREWHKRKIDRSICNLLFAKLSARDAIFVGHRARCRWICLDTAYKLILCNEWRSMQSRWNKYLHFIYLCRGYVKYITNPKSNREMREHCIALQWAMILIKMIYLKQHLQMYL